SVAIKMEKTNLDRYFNRIISSHELKLAKEEKGFWEKLQTTESFEVNKTLFIDDNFGVLDAAKDYGIEYLLAIRKPDSRGYESSMMNTRCWTRLNRLQCCDYLSQLLNRFIQYSRKAS
ncbi:MAG: hypothetical protein OQK76_05370, partial [Gammaproteobacteria bacterium]|nr:hypothetical protein [Gammaproteobacteria bacterium]